MDARFDGSTVQAGHQARERFYDSRGYGTPKDGNLELAPVEAAHLLFRGDLEAVVDHREDASGTRLDLHDFLATSAVSEVSFFVYKELRDRGFYLSPADAATGFPAAVGEGTRAFEVYPRGKGPWDDEVAYVVWAVSEREDVPLNALQELLAVPDRHAGRGPAGGFPQGVLGVVDEESEVTYLAVSEPTLTGSSQHAVPPVDGSLLYDRCLVADPPSQLYETAFYGQQLQQDRSSVQLSLVEAAYLADTGVLSFDNGSEQAFDRVVTRGREVEGDRFDRRLAVYRSLREAGVVPKTGFKFGADFRTYANVTSVDDLGHSEYLVRVLEPEATFSPRDLSLDVRLAHGVRKTMVFAHVDETVDFLAVERITP